MRALALTGLLLAQAPTPPPRLGPVTSYGDYGPSEPAELSQIAAGDETHQGKRVLTKGELRPLAGNLQYFILAEGTSRVLVIPVPELADVSRRLLDRSIEVTGIVRSLPPQQRTVACRGTLMVESKCLDGDLPALPDLQLGWPPISITVITMSDVGPAAAAPPEVDTDILGALATEGARMAGQEVRAVGQFAGRNLFGDLPAGSQQTPSDWVLKRGPHAIWVTGRKPQGKGWRLDPAYKGDTTRWLEVTGRVEWVGGVTFLRASKVTLVGAPRAER
jgi:hypothetical protein